MKLPCVLEVVRRCPHHLQSAGAPFLRGLYALLGNFPLRSSIAVSYQQGIHELSIALFDNLEDRFKRYFDSIKEMTSCSTKTGKKIAPLDFWCRIEELILLLRCCLTILAWLDFDPNHILEKSEFLLSILGRLISFDVGGRNGKQFIVFKKVKRKRTYDKDGYTTSVIGDFVASLRFFEPNDPCCSSLCALLEVYADELLAAESLRNHFMCAVSALSQSPLCKFNITGSKIELVLEVLCAHLMLVGTDEQAVENALDRLNRQHTKELRFPELSVSAALNLLLNHILLSAPRLLQVHLILLVSEAIDSETSEENMRLHVRETDCYFMAFEKSLYLYKRHISSCWDDSPPCSKDTFSDSCPPERSIPSFRSCIKQVTVQKLDLLDSKSETLWSQYMQNKASESDSDLLSASIAYIKETTNALEDTYRDEISTVLISLTLRAFSDAPRDGILHIKRGGSPKDVYFLSSILRLMSISMSRIIWCLRHGENKGSWNELKDFSSCRGYELLVGAIRCSQQFDVHLPVQSSLLEMLKDHPVSSHKESIWMLVYFSGLLSLSFVSGFDFFIKACLSVMVALLNLMSFEEGNLAAVRSLLGAGPNFAAFGYSSKDAEAVEGQKSVEIRKRSSQVASTFLKVQRSCPEIQSEWADRTDAIGHNGRVEETGNGEVILKSLLEGSVEDFDDLVDFVEFKEGKDYSLWLKSWQRFRRWRLEKTAVLRWRQKKKSMKRINRKKR